MDGSPSNPTSDYKDDKRDRKPFKPSSIQDEDPSIQSGRKPRSNKWEDESPGREPFKKGKYGDHEDYIPRDNQGRALSPDDRGKDRRRVDPNDPDYTDYSQRPGRDGSSKPGTQRDGKSKSDYIPEEKPDDSFEDQPGGRGKGKNQEQSVGTGKGKYRDQPEGEEKGKGKYRDQPGGEERGRGKYIDQPEGEEKGKAKYRDQPEGKGRIEDESEEISKNKNRSKPSTRSKNTASSKNPEHLDYSENAEINSSEMGYDSQDSYTQRKSRKPSQPFSRSSKNNDLDSEDQESNERPCVRPRRDSKDLKKETSPSTSPQSGKKKSILKKRGQQDEQRPREDSKPKGVAFKEDVDESNGSKKDPTSDERRYIPTSGVAAEENQEKKSVKNSGKSGPGGKKPDEFGQYDEDYVEKMVVPESRKSIKSNTLLVPGQEPPSHIDAEKGRDELKKQNEVLNVPVKTYTQLKNLKTIREDLEENLKEIDEDPSLKETVDEQAEIIAEFGEEVMEDLEENNPDSNFIQEMKEEIQIIKKEQEENNKLSKPDPKKKDKIFNDLINWQKKLNKLEVKDPTINKDEKKQIEDMARRKSFQALVVGPQSQDAITPDSIKEGKISDPDLKEYVKKFLKKYSEKMKNVDSPLSRVLAQEADDCLETLEKVETTRPPQQTKELSKLLATSICTKFKPREDSEAHENLDSEQPHTDDNVLKFNDLLRAVNELSETPFNELDNMVHDPSTKFNLLRMRQDKIKNYPESKYKDKEADILKLNSLEEDKLVIEEIIRNIGKDSLPPRTVQKDSNSMRDSRFSDMQINFIPLGKDSMFKKPADEPEITEIKTHTFNSDDSFGDIKFSPSKFEEENEENEESPLQKRITMMKPNLIDSENEVQDSSISNDNPTASYNTVGEIDYRDDMADRLELIIEGVNNAYGDIRLARQDLKHHSKAKRMQDDKKLEFLDQLTKFVDEVNSLTKEGDKFKPPYEELKNEIIEKTNPQSSSIPASHNKGLIKMWGKYKRHMRKLKAENLTFVEEVQQSEFMKPENNVNKEAELDALKEQLEEVQNAIAQEHAQEEKETTRKSYEAPILAQKRLSVYDIKKLAEDDQKKHEEMEKKVETLTDSIENFRRASVMQATLPAGKNKRGSVVKNDSIQIKPKEKNYESDMPVVVLEERDEELQNNMEGSFDSSEEGPDNEANFEAEKGLQKLRTQSLAAIAAIEADEDSDDEARRLVDILESPEMRKFVEYGDMEDDLDFLRNALEESQLDDQKIKEALVVIYEKTKQMRLTDRDVKKLMKPVDEVVEDEILDEQGKPDPKYETPKERKARERIEAEAKNIRNIVEGLNNQLKELKERTQDGFKTLGGIKPNKLNTIHTGIKDSLDLLKEEPMPDPGCISEIKKVNRNTETGIPKAEEQTAESVAETEEMEALIKAINKNVDQLAMNMTDVAEYRMIRAGHELCSSAKAKNVDVKTTKLDGGPPDNSEKLTDDDRKELKRYLDKLNEATGSASSVANEWMYSKANEVSQNTEKIKKENQRCPEIQKITDTIKKLKSHLNEEGNTLYVPRCVMEISKYHDMMQEKDQGKQNGGDLIQSDPKTAAEFAKSIVGLQNASNRFQDVLEIINEEMRELKRNTEKALKARQADDVKQDDKSKQRTSVNKGVIKGLEMKTGEEDSVEKYYYSEFTEGSAEGHTIGRDKEAAQRLELVKIRDIEEDGLDDGPIGMKQINPQEYSSEKHSEKHNKPKSMPRKSRMDHIEEHLMRGDKEQYHSDSSIDNNHHLDDDVEIDQAHDSEVEDQRFKIDELTNKQQKPQKDNRITSEEHAYVKKETDENSSIYDSEGHKIDKEEGISDDDYKRSSGYGEDNEKINKKKDSRPSSEKTEEGYFKRRPSEGRQTAEDKYELNEDGGYLRNQRRPSEGRQSAEDKYELNEDGGYLRNQPRRDDAAGDERGENIEAAYYKGSSRHTSEKNSKDPSIYQAEDGQQNSSSNKNRSRQSSKGGRLEEEEEGHKSSTRKSDKGKESNYGSSRRSKQLSVEAEEGYYRKNTDDEKYEVDPDKQEYNDEAYYHNNRDPQRTAPANEEGNTETGYYARGKSNPHNEDALSSSKNSSPQKPKKSIVREGEIIVAEIEEGKPGNPIRFSIIEPNGRKSVIESRHVIDPNSESGVQFYKARKSVLPLDNKYVDPEENEKIQDTMHHKTTPAKSNVLIEPTFAENNQDKYNINFDSSRSPAKNSRLSEVQNRALIDPDSAEFKEEMYHGRASDTSIPSKRASVLAPSKEHRPSVRKSIILDGRSKDPKDFNKETVVFPRESIAKTLHAQDPIEEYRDEEQDDWHQEGGQASEHAVERVVPKLRDTNQLHNIRGSQKQGSAALDSERDRPDTNSSAYSSSQLPSSARSGKRSSAFQAPIMKPLNTVEDRKSYFIQDKENVEGEEVPRLVEVDYVYFRPKDEKKEPNHDPDVDPEVDPCESFYLEADQARGDVPKIPGTKIFERRLRKLKPEEIEKREEEYKVQQKNLNNPKLILCESMEKSKEWAAGKPVFVKKIDFIKNPKPIPPRIEEVALNYYKMIERTSDFNESVLYPEKGVITSEVLDRNSADPEKNYFDSFTEPVATPLKFMVAQGPDGTFRVFQLEEFEGNPLIETETGGRFSLPAEVEKKDKEGLSTMYRHSGTFNDAPILEPQTSRIIDLSVVNVPKISKVEFERLCNKKILGPEELSKFLEMASNIPNSKVELFKQSPDSLNGQSIVEQGLVLNSLPPDERSRLLNQISLLQKKGKLKSDDLSKEPKIELAESIRLSYLEKSDKTKSSLLKEKKVQAVQLEETYKGRPLYHIADSVLISDQAKVQPATEEKDEDQKDLTQKLKEIIDITENMSEIQPHFNDLSRRCVDENEDVKEQMKALARLYDMLAQESKLRGKPIEDWMFLPNGTSMVNNSLKSEIPFKDAEWMKLSDLYKFQSLLANFNPKELFPPGGRAAELVACFAAMCDYPERIKKMFGSSTINKEGQYMISVSNKGKLEPILIDEKVPVEQNGDSMFVVEPSNHTAGREANFVSPQARFGSPKIKPTAENEVEIWPQLLAKAKAKSLGCYERLLNQELVNMLADLTNMPVKTYDTRDLDFKWLREGYKRNCIMICKASRAWINQSKREAAADSTENELQYWNISQSIELSDGQLMIEIKHHLCDNAVKKSKLKIMQTGTLKSTSKSAKTG